MDKSRSTTTTSSYAPRSPDLSALTSAGFVPDPQTIPPQSSLYPTHSYPHNRESFSLPQSAAPSSGYLAPPQDDSFGASIYGAQPFHPQDNSYMPQPLPPQQQTSSRPRRGVKQDPGENEWLPGGMGQFQPYHDGMQFGAPAPPQPVKAEIKEEAPSKPAPGEIEGTVVKTKFPVARIKRIVQADEDVGKVAQVTPVVVSKALELFMMSLALRSADEARGRQSKRVTGQHLKAIIQSDEQFDFLSEIVSKIPDAPTSKDSAKKGHKDEESEDEEPLEDDYEAPPKKKSKATATRSRRKKESP